MMTRTMMVVVMMIVIMMMIVITINTISITIPIIAGKPKRPDGNVAGQATALVDAS